MSLIVLEKWVKIYMIVLKKFFQNIFDGSENCLKISLIVLKKLPTNVSLMVLNFYLLKLSQIVLTKFSEKLPKNITDSVA